MKNKSSRKSGFTLVEIMVVIAIIGLLATIAIPNFMRAKTESQKRICVANLQQIEKAKVEFAINNRTTNRVLSLEGIFGTNQPVCPAGGQYTIGHAGIMPTCSIPEHNIPASTPVLLETLQIGNCSFINIGGREINDETIKYTLVQIKQFETTFPNLRITGRQVFPSSAGGIMGIFIWHEPRTNAVVLEQPAAH